MNDYQDLPFLRAVLKLIGDRVLRGERKSILWMSQDIQFLKDRECATYARVGTMEAIINGVRSRADVLAARVDALEASVDFVRRNVDKIHAAEPVLATHADVDRARQALEKKIGSWAPVDIEAIVERLEALEASAKK